MKRIKRIFEDTEISRERKLYLIETTFECLQVRIVDNKEDILNDAKESNKDKFMLVAGMNGFNNIFCWCEEENNFIGMTNFGNKKVIYSFNELKETINFAHEWIKKWYEIQNEYGVTNLQLIIL